MTRNSVTYGQLNDLLSMSSRSSVDRALARCSRDVRFVSWTQWSHALVMFYTERNKNVPKANLQGIWSYGTCRKISLNFIRQLGT